MSNGDNPAFGYSAALGGGVAITSGGLTKREYFAAMAMQGYISRSHTNDPGFFTDYAVRCADELLAALEQKPEVSSD